MNTHLSHDDLLAVGDRVPLAPHAAQHLATCERCRREADALRALIVDLQHAEVPEPSPLFWEQFSGRVAQAVRGAGPLTGEAGGPAAWWHGWTHWTVVSPSAPASVASSAAPAAEDPVVDAEDGEDWALIAEAAGGLDYDDVRAIENSNDVVKVLRKASKAEENSGRLYRSMEKIYKGFDVADLFAKLAEEEDKHKDRIEKVLASM